MSGLRILYVFRAPLGGLFRQVIDLVRHQAEAGHQIGIVADSMTGGARAEEVFAELGPMCPLGIHRMPMHRNPHPSDVTNIRAIARLARELNVDVIHGHGSKGGLYARFDASLWRNGPVRAYTPHGGSFNYRPGTLVSKLYMLTETFLERGTDLFTFESAYIGSRFHEEVGQTDKLVRVVLNGLYPHEFEPRKTVENPTDFLFIGELRAAKGIDTLLKAVARLSTNGKTPTITIIGGGPDEALLKSMTVELGIAKQATFTGPMPGAEGLKRGRIMVVPSRAESLPYIVLEAVAAQVPLITTNVGGIPEIVGQDYDWMIPPEDLDRLTALMGEALTLSPEALASRSLALADRARPIFDVSKMANAVIAAHREAIALRKSRA
ncbi:MAG: glycosyltransferase family 4 protein [Proteobacteria bacterium]|nr:glycosyltransferase family 4 protein [Pseudomonadota bacterium]